MRRRDFIAGLGATATACPAVVRAQPAKLPIVGLLGPVGSLSEQLGAFTRRIGQLGWTEGRNIAFESRPTDGTNERYTEVAEEFVQLKVNAIVAFGTAPTVAARQATSTIPIISGLMGDPVDSGLAASIARPGGNLTGLTTGSTYTVGKRIQLVSELIPTLHQLAVIGHIDVPTTALEIHEAREVAQKLGIELVALEIRTRDDIARAFETLSSGVGALHVIPSTFLGTHAVRVFTFANVARLPTMCAGRLYVEAGGLVSYAVNFASLFERAADLLDKVLRGTKPADIPIEQPTKYELIVNLATARAIKLQVPESFLLRADEVIE